MSVFESFQSYCAQSSSTCSSFSHHQDGHIDYISGSDDYTAGEHHDKYVDCDFV